MSPAQQAIMDRLNANRARGQRWAAFYGDQGDVARQMVSEGLIGFTPGVGVFHLLDFAPLEDPPDQSYYEDDE